MPRFWMHQEANPLNFSTFKVEAEGGPTDASLRSLILARALASQGVLAFPGSNIEKSSATFLLHPTLKLKNILASTQSTIGSIALASPMDVGMLSLSKAQEAIKFSIRHGLSLRGWTLIGNTSTMQTMWVRNLDVSQGKNNLDGCKVEIQFTNARSKGSSYEFKLSLEPFKVTTRRWEPRMRAVDNEVFVLPSLARGVVVDPPHSGASEEANPEVAAWVASQYEQAYSFNAQGCPPPSSLSSLAAASSSGDPATEEVPAMKMSFVALRGGNAEDGFWQHGAQMEDESFGVSDTGLPPQAALPARIPLAMLLAEEPTEKKMSKLEQGRVTDIMKQDLVATGLPEGLLSPQEDLRKAASGDAPNNGNNAAASTDQPQSINQSLDMVAAKASLQAGECGTWSKGCPPLGKGAPLFTTGNGNALTEEFPRQPQAKEENEDEEVNSWGYSYTVPLEATKISKNNKQVVTVWADLERLQTRLSEGPSWAKPAPPTPLDVNHSTTSSSSAAATAAAAAAAAENPSSASSTLDSISVATKKASKGNGKTTKSTAATKRKKPLTVNQVLNEADALAKQGAAEAKNTETTSNATKTKAVKGKKPKASTTAAVVAPTHTPIDAPAFNENATKAEATVDSKSVAEGDNDGSGGKSNTAKSRKPLSILSPNKSTKAQQKRKGCKTEVASTPEALDDVSAPEAKKPKKAPAPVTSKMSAAGTDLESINEPISLSSPELAAGESGGESASSILPRSVAELSKLKVSELKELCSKMGVEPLKGAKMNLVAQLASMISAKEI